MDVLLRLYSANAFILWFISIVLIVVLVLIVLRLQARVNRSLGQYQRLTRGGSATNLSGVLDVQVARIDDLTARADQLDALCNQLDARVDRSLQQFAVVRFNPFPDTGGDQSFSVALLDGRGDGVVLSSLFSRANSRVFAKPLARGESKYTLTDEERQAIELATEKVGVGRGH